MLKVIMGDWAIAAFDNATVAQHSPTHRLPRHPPRCGRPALRHNKRRPGGHRQL